MGGPTGTMRDGVVEVAVVGGVIAAGPAAGQIAAAHEISQRLGGDVARFGGAVAGMGQRDVFGAGGQFGDQLSGDQLIGTDR